VYSLPVDQKEAVHTTPFDLKRFSSFGVKSFTDKAQGIRLSVTETDKRAGQLLDCARVGKSGKI
jgi:hypothetical protein